MLNLGVPVLLPSQLGFDCITLLSFNIKMLCISLCPFSVSTIWQKKKKTNECHSYTASKIPEAILSLLLNSGSVQLYRNTLPSFSFGDVLPLTHRNVCCTITPTVLSSNWLDCLTAANVSS